MTFDFRLSTPRGRFAPSPTGELHLGNARTALLAWLWTRSERGRFAMRVEDLDRPRVRPGLAQRQLDELRWLGLDWDEGPIFQSERSALYDQAIEKLRAGGGVYECFCSRAEISAVASAPHGDEGPRYPGTCRDLGEAERSRRSRTRNPALRLRIPPGFVHFDDLIAGPQTFDPQAEVGDFVLKRADGIHAYQLAVVADDVEMGMTQVLRGADLLSSTARQIILYRMLGAPEPRWAHAPLVLGPGGERFSKRDASSSLSAVAQRGEDPRRIVALLASISGLPADPAGCLPADLVGTFAFGRIPRAPARVAGISSV